MQSIRWKLFRSKFVCVVCVLPLSKSLFLFCICWKSSFDIGLFSYMEYAIVIESKSIIYDYKLCIFINRFCFYIQSLMQYNQRIQIHINRTWKHRALHNAPRKFTRSFAHTTPSTTYKRFCFSFVRQNFEEFNV